MHALSTNRLREPRLRPRRLITSNRNQRRNAHGAVARVDILGGDPFGLLAVDIGVRQGVGQGKPVGQGRLRSALRIRGAAEGQCGTGRIGVDTLSVASGILAQPLADPVESRLDRDQPVV
jgi:hypothetical protein